MQNVHVFILKLVISELSVFKDYVSLLSNFVK